MVALKMDPFPPNEDGEMTDEEMEIWFEFTRSVGNAIGVKVTRWSCDEVFDFMAVPFPHARWITYKGWRTPEDMRFLPINATWLDIWKQIESLVSCGTDHHHRFIEDVGCTPEGEVFFGCGS